MVVLATTLLALGGSRAAAEDGTPVKREILALYDGSEEGNAEKTRIHRYAEMPLNHLGFIIRFHDVRTKLPEPSEMGRYRGVLTWFVRAVPDGNAYLAWAAQVAALNLSYVILGDLGVAVEPRSKEAVNLWLDQIGLSHRGEIISPTRGARVADKDSALAEFECRLDPVLPDFPLIETVEGRSRPVVLLEAPRQDGRTPAAVVAIGEKGGFAALHYEFCHPRPPLLQGRWLINPFAFFGLAFGSERFPVPDTTTTAGRRIYFGRLDSERWSAPSEIEHFRKSESMSAEAVLQELVEPFADLPVTLDLHDSDLGRLPQSAPKAQALAQHALALPQVERASRAFRTPSFARYDAAYPSIGNLTPLRSPPPESVVYGATSDEVSYAGANPVGSIGFHAVRQTLDNTETPRRLKPFNLNYHAYAGQHAPLFRAVRELLEAARSAELAPLHASRYAAIVDGFFSSKIFRITPRRFDIRGRGALQTVRFDEAQGLEADLEESIGVIGQTRRGAALYISLDESVEPARVVLRNADSSRPPGRLSLVESRWLVRGVKQDLCALSFEAQGFGAGAFTWSGAMRGSYIVTLSRNGQRLWQLRVDADDSRRLAFTASIGALNPLTVTVQRSDSPPSCRRDTFPSAAP